MAGPSSDSTVESTVLPAIRRDLLTSKQIFEEQVFFVVKDPISLQYFRLSAEDYFLASLFNGKRTFAEIRAEFVREFPHVRLSHSPAELNERIMRFANELALMNFILVGGKSARRRADLQKTRKSKTAIASLLGRIFYFRFSLFDPDELFARMVKPLGWIWTRTMFFLSLVIILLGVLVFIENVGRIAPTMSAFLSPHNLLLLWLGTILVKVIHELGHGLTCKHFGGEVHEIGVLVMLLTPFFFVNVTDSWMMPKRRHRIMVAAAGIYVELIIAAFATFLWAIAQPGIFQQALFNIMVVTSVWTIVFNANPLMRFDGYYILTDLLEIPNLRNKSRAYVSDIFSKVLFGRSQSSLLSRMPLPKRRFALFVVYAMLAYFYGLLILYKMSQMFTHLLAPYGLEKLGSVLSSVVVVIFILLPAYKFFAGAGFTSEDWKTGGRFRRLAVVGAAACLIFTACCFLRVEHTIARSSAIELAMPENVRSETDGFVEEIYVKEGDHVKAGQPIARLSNPDVTASHDSLQLQVQMAETQVQQALGTDHPNQLRQAQTIKEQYTARLRETKKDLANLTLKAAADGVVLTPYLENRLGTLLVRGTLFCQLAPLDSLLIKVPLSENQVRYVAEGQMVRVKTTAYSDKTLVGYVTQKPLTFLEKDLPPVLSAQHGGDVPTKPGREGEEVPLERTYHAHVRVDNSGNILRPGMSGRVKIFTGQVRLGVLIRQSLLDLISLDYRL